MLDRQNDITAHTGVASPPLPCGVHSVRLGPGLLAPWSFLFCRFAGRITAHTGVASFTHTGVASPPLPCGVSRIVPSITWIFVLLAAVFVFSAPAVMAAPPTVEGEWDSWDGDYWPYSGFNRRFPTSAQHQRATTYFGYTYRLGSDSMKQYNGGEKIFDSGVTAHGIDFSYCYSERIRYFTSFTTNAAGHSINRNSKMVKDFEANALDYSQRLLDRVNSLAGTSYKTAYSSVFDPDRTYFERVNGLTFVLLAKPMWAVSAGMQQRSHRYKKMMFYEPFVPGASIGGIIPRSLVDLTDAVEQTITHIGGTRQFRHNLTGHAGLRHILTYTKMDSQSAARYFEVTPYAAANWGFGDFSRISAGVDRYGFSLELGYFQGRELEVRLGIESEDMDIRGKTQIPGYQDLRFVRNNTRQSLSISRRF